LSFDTVEDGYGEFEDEEDMVADSVLAQMLRSAILNQALANSRRALADRKENPPAQVSTPSVAPVVAVSLLEAADGVPYGVVVSVEAADFPGECFDYRLPAQLPPRFQGEYRAGGRVHTPSRVVPPVGRHQLSQGSSTYL
jgi:hypothetical protein